MTTQMARMMEKMKARMMKKISKVRFFTKLYGMNFFSEDQAEKSVDLAEQNKENEVSKNDGKDLKGKIFYEIIIR